MIALGYGHGRAPTGWFLWTSRSTGWSSTARTTTPTATCSTSRGETTEASDAALTPEGHGIRYDDEGHVIGVTIINARRLLDRDGHVTIRLPQEVQVAAGDLAGALS